MYSWSDLREACRDASTRPVIKHCEQNALKKAHNARNVEYLDKQRSLTEAVDSSVTRSDGTAARVRQGYREFPEIFLMCTSTTSPSP